MLVLLVAAALVGIAAALMTIGRSQAQPYILGLLAVLAMVGLFNLFALAAGMIRFARSADDPVTARIADHAFDGLAVTDARGHVVYFNAAYLSCRLQGGDPQLAAHWGHRLAAQVVQHRGALIPSAAMPSLNMPSFSSVAEA